MAGLSHYSKNLHPLQTWSTNFPSLSSSSSSSSSSSNLMTYMKITKTLIHTIIYTQFLRLQRAFIRAKSIFSSFISHAKGVKNKYEHKVRLGSFRLHYNWSSSRVMPAVPARSYYDSSWNLSAVISTDKGELSGYLQWLEDEKEVDDGDSFYSANCEDATTEDIDRLAELFIASSHEKFLLEKQESYRSFQEMLARSV